MNWKLFFSVLLAFIFVMNFSAQENYNTLVYKGNQEFDQKNYESSSSKYMEALQLKDNDFAAHYNLGNSLYKRKMFEEAKAEYEKASQHATSLPDKAAALYNLGNANMETNNSEKAAELYKQALKQDPYNEAIRKNYEIAMLKEKEKKDQKNQKDNTGDGDGKEQDQDKNKGQEKGDSPQNQNQGEGLKNQGEGEGEDPSKNKNDNAGKMPKELEDGLLNRVQNKERETAKRILNKNSYSLPQSNEKDW